MTVLEAASEKPQRGRPPVFSREVMATIANVVARAPGHRQIQNRIYALSAYGPLQQAEGFPIRFAWLVGADGETWRWGLMTELGRLLDTFGPEHIVEWADLLCLRKPSSKDGQRSIRTWRLSHRGAPSP